MRLLPTLALILFFAFESKSQWDCIAQEHPHITLYDVQYFNDSTIFAAGVYLDSVVNPAIVLRTFDSGATWDTTFIGTLSNGRAIHFPTLNTGYLGGADGQICKTVDGGASWFTCNAPTSQYLIEDIYFTSTQTGYVCSYGDTSFISTTDGGQTWDVDTVYDIEGAAVCFPSSQNGYVVSAYGVFSTSNAGVTWSAQQNPVDYYYSSGDTPADNVVYVGGNDWGSWNGLIGKSTDYGQTWQFWNILEIDNFETLSAPSTNTVYATGNWNSQPQQVIIKSNDGGTTWGSQVLNNSQSLPRVNEIDCLNDSMCVSVGHWGQIFLTNNGGGSSIPVGVPSEFQDVDLVLTPNPTCDNISVTTELKMKSAQITIFDMQGKVVMEQVLQSKDQEFSIHVENLHNGMYTVVVRENDSVSSARFLKVGS